MDGAACQGRRCLSGLSSPEFTLPGPLSLLRLFLSTRRRGNCPNSKPSSLLRLHQPMQIALLGVDESGNNDLLSQRFLK
ncbi:hypothetical protein Taro_027460 [Colocasia esculenta]|uniref:Uncharacterized protein n=1 Tax=Colocasia esculenta TaxID=4460 RepID=A0A843VMK0_COLES|nr:hypothetical protein [Colocasia esculenta]